MKFQMIVDDNMIRIDDAWLYVDLSAIPVDVSNVWAITWDSDAELGFMEQRNGGRNIPFTDAAFLQPFIDAHAEQLALVNEPPPLTAVKVNKKSALSSQAQQLIMSGFESSALGTAHTYGSQFTDQLNLIGAVAASTDMPFPCADASGVWERRSHTAAQLVQVAADGAARKQAILIALDVARDAVDAASDVAGVDAVAMTGV